MTIEFALIIGFLFHLIGDYITQNDWMAQNKTKSFLPAFIHATIYSLPFLYVCFSWWWLLIWISHFLIDRYRLAVYWIRFVNLKKAQTFKIGFHKQIFKKGDVLTMSPEEVLILKVNDTYCDTVTYNPNVNYLSTPFGYFSYNNTPTGYDSDKPLWMSVWLMIIIDNVFHILINSLSIYLNYVR